MKLHYRNVHSALILFFLFTGLIRAQAIVASPDKIVFTAGADGSVQPQTIALSSSGASLLLSVSVTTYNTGNWLYASPAIVSTPNNIIVSANANNLPQGIYDGAIMVSSSGATNSPVAIPVSLTVGTPPPAGAGLAATPTSLSFIGQAGGAPPQAQQLSVTSTPAGVTFTTTAAASDNGNWLQISTLLATAPTTVAVSVNTAGMSAGVYSGSITFTPVSGTAFTVPVTLTLGGGATLQTSASSLQFFYQLGWFVPAYQTFDISSSGALLNFAVVTSTTDGTGWLRATPSTGNTKQTITVSVVPGYLGPGTYSGKIAISSTSALNNTLELPVTLTISNSPLLTVGPSPAPFVYQSGGTAPAAQAVAIGSSSAPVDFSVTTSTTDGNSWLGVSPSTGTTPQNLTVVVSPGSLSAGTYSGTISVTSSAVSNSPARIPVTMTISTASQLSVNVQSIYFNYQLNGANQVYAQQLGVYSSGLPVDVAIGVTTTSCGTNWLRSYQTAITTPQVITIAFDPLLLTTPGNCQGVITLTSAGGASPVTIPVALTVSSSPLLNITPLALNFTAPFDSEETAAQNVNLKMTDNSAVSYTVTLSSTTGGNWVRVTPVGGTTPATIAVSADPSTLGSGTYTANIVIVSPALTTGRFIPVTFKVIPTETVNVAPLSVSFTQASGGPPPASQNITVASSRGGALAFSLATSAGNAGSWLSATPNSGNTPASVAVSVNGTALTPGNYQGSVTLWFPAAANSPVTIPVNLLVTAGQIISAAPASLSFSYRAGGAAPATQTLNVTSISPGLAVTALSTSTGNWLSVTPLSNSTPTSFTVSVAPAGLATGSYNGTITLSAPGAANTTVPVKFDVLPAAVVSILEIASAASGVRGVVSPGEIVTLKGETMGPAAGVTLNLTATGMVDTTLAGSRVFIDEFAAPLLYTSAGQINAIVPYEVAGRSIVQVTVEYQGVRSAAYTMQLGATAPGLFTVTQNGRGQGAILNQDNSYNSASVPAAIGSVVQVFGTGEGLVTGAQTGSVTAGLLLPVANVSATVGGVAANVTFAGAAPGQVAGLFQVNLAIPQGVPVGDEPITITIGGVPSQTGVTVAVK